MCDVLLVWVPRLGRVAVVAGALAVVAAVVYAAVRGIRNVRTRPAGAVAVPLHRDVRVLRIAYQVAVVAVIALVALWLYGNFSDNAASSRLPTGFDFLRQPAGVDIRDSDFRPSQPVCDALAVGFANTIRVSVVGIVAATVLGVLVGIARLSQNWLVRKGAALYIESIRNVPVLVIIIFFYTAVVLRLPPISGAIELVDAVVFSNRGLVVPWFDAPGGASGTLLVVGAGVVAALAVMVWRTRVSDATGAPHRRVLWGLATLVAIALGGYVVLGAPVNVTLPSRDGRVVAGGISLGPEFAAGLVALVVYTASHIAEIVRGSIQAVPKGQTEAANAIALSGFQRLRFVILPQAFRIAIPPVANQYLNLTKNSSLVAAIGYFELTRLAQNAVANGNPAPQVYAILMAGYLFLSLTISLLANLVNRRLALGTR